MSGAVFQQTQTSFPRKRESIVARLRDKKTDTLPRIGVRGRRWIPAFAGMTMVFVLSFFLIMIPSRAESAPPPPSATDVVKNFYAQLTDTMKQGETLGFAGRYKKLEPAMRQAFNLPLMARFAVGLVWSSATPAELAALNDAEVIAWAQGTCSTNAANEGGDCLMCSG